MTSVIGIPKEVSHGTDFLLILLERTTSFVFADLPEPYFVARLSLSQFGDINTDCGGDFGVAAGGLTVNEQYYGQPVTGYLHGTEGNAIRNDIGCFPVLYLGALKPVAHAVSLN